jgi:Protein of unknown function (DUF3631)
MTGIEENFIPEPRPLAEFLVALEVFICRFVVLTKAQAFALALWVAHTWAIGAARATPYPFINSPEEESGKTRVHEVLRELVPSPFATANISDAALFRLIDKVIRDGGPPTLFIDEVDKLISAAEHGQRRDMVGLLNDGYRRNGQRVYRMGGSKGTDLQDFDVFCPKALAGLSGCLPLTLRSRCIPIDVKRRRSDEPIEDFYPEDVETETLQLRAELQAWAEPAVKKLLPMRPPRVEGVRDRTNEVWRPLLAIAELAGREVNTRARRTVRALYCGGNDEPSEGLRLLGDCRTVFGERLQQIATVDLIVQLGLIEESFWGEKWIDQMGIPNKGAPSRLAKLLRPFGVRPTDVRVGDWNGKGYCRDDFVDAWARYLPLPATSATAATSGSHKQRDVADVADVAATRGGEENGVPLLFCSDCEVEKKVDVVKAGITYLTCGHQPEEA